MKFYICPVCGNVIYMMNGEISRVKCCGEVMEELVPNTVDASAEKHLPFCKIDNDKVVVSIGEEIHPMEDDHYIMWVLSQNGKNISFVKFDSTDEAECEFNYEKGMVIYSYCNKHKLWKVEL